MEIHYVCHVIDDLHLNFHSQLNYFREEQYFFDVFIVEPLPIQKALNLFTRIG